MKRTADGTVIFCPKCGCPLQKLADGYGGKVKGTLEDALDRHCEVVHPDDPA